MSIRFQSDDIHEVLKKSTYEPSCDVVFALFLEPSDVKDARLSFVESLIDSAIRYFQPSPTMIHCEYIIPPNMGESSDKTQFATYLGRKAAWQTDLRDGFGYYLKEKADQWRAVPIFASNAGNRVRYEADKEEGVEYSLSRYITSAYPMRAFAGLLSSKRRAPAHCATLMARILNNALPEQKLSQVSAWYGPATLYQELCQKAAFAGVHVASQSSHISTEVENNIDTILRKPMTHENIAQIGDQGCMDAIRALTTRATDALVMRDSAAERITQQQLATALLRWVILRNDFEV